AQLAWVHLLEGDGEVVAIREDSAEVVRVEGGRVVGARRTPASEARILAALAEGLPPRGPHPEERSDEGPTQPGMDGRPGRRRIVLLGDALAMENLSEAVSLAGFTIVHPSPSVTLEAAAATGAWETSALELASPRVLGERRAWSQRLTRRLWATAAAGVLLGL